MAKVKYVLLLPLTFNDKSKVPKQLRDRIFDDLFQLAGGYHIAGTGKGAYRMKSGQKQVDDSLEVWVVIEEEFEAELREMISGFGAQLGQESMYLERTSSKVEFVQPVAVKR